MKWYRVIRAIIPFFPLSQEGDEGLQIAFPVGQLGHPSQLGRLQAHCETACEAVLARLRQFQHPTVGFIPHHPLPL